MKRILVLILAVLMVVASLAACGDSAKNVDINALFNTINTQYPHEGLKVLGSTSDLSRYYNIDEKDVKAFAAEMSTDAKQFTEVIIIEAVDSDAAARIATLLNNHLDVQVNQAKSYTQEDLAMIESRKVQQSGSFVYLVVDQNADAIEKLIADAVK